MVHNTPQPCLHLGGQIQQNCDASLVLHWRSSGCIWNDQCGSHLNIQFTSHFSQANSLRPTVDASGTHFRHALASFCSGKLTIAPQIPGVNVPQSQLAYYFISLLISGILHEFGHAVAAIR